MLVLCLFLVNVFLLGVWRGVVCASRSLVAFVLFVRVARVCRVVRIVVIFFFRVGRCESVSDPRSQVS